MLEDGSNLTNAPLFVNQEKMQPYMFSYTSGTTGDSKGVKMTHDMVLRLAMSEVDTLGAVNGDAFISYLPYPHSFEQGVFAATLLCEGKIGFYQGDPLKLVEDCAMLKPKFFPSVPRLYTRIYSRIKGQFDAATGCKKWLIDRALSTKIEQLKADGSVYNGCYDSLVFSKVANLLGGNV